MKTNIGGERLGSGNKQEIALRNYERSSHDLGYIWRSSMSPGTLVPFMKELALPGDSFDIDLNLNALTLPTIGPLFGSYKIQADVFQCPIRLYQGKLHMNMLNIGLDMSTIKLPLLKFRSYYDPERDENQMVNPSCLYKYLGFSGAGRYGTGTSSGSVVRYLNAVPILGYYDIYKNYYANKQEERGFIIHTGATGSSLISTTDCDWTDPSHTESLILGADNEITADTETKACELRFTIADDMSPDGPNLDLIVLNVDGEDVPIKEVFNNIEWDDANNACLCDDYIGGSNILVYMPQQTVYPRGTNDISLLEFDLSNIDDMRQSILADVASSTAFEIDENSDAPYSSPLELLGDNTYSAVASQEGLAIKTYQSDLFNNWISTEWIDGTNGINEITAVSTAGDEFTIDALNLAHKVYTMLNRIAISGGSYDDWLDAVYTHERSKSTESPVYHGSLIKELTFQEVISQSDTDNHPLGTLAGRGTLTDKHKGGKIKIKVDEPSYILGIVSITPRIDYSQGNDWDLNLETLDDLHKPALDEIGYQDLLTDQLAWFGSVNGGGSGAMTYYEVGKQPAWINYMTQTNKVRGNFADANKEMFMTLNRRFEFTSSGIDDITTYIDPVKYNHIFADTNLDAQNFWVQIKVDNIARRKMSAKVIPNL
jgi:hypothetical protein